MRHEQWLRLLAEIEHESVDATATLAELTHRRFKPTITENAIYDTSVHALLALGTVTSAQVRESETAAFVAISLLHQLGQPEILESEDGLYNLPMREFLEANELHDTYKKCVDQQMSQFDTLTAITQTNDSLKHVYSACCDMVAFVFGVDKAAVKIAKKNRTQLHVFREQIQQHASNVAVRGCVMLHALESLKRLKLSIQTHLKVLNLLKKCTADARPYGVVTPDDLRKCEADVATYLSTTDNSDFKTIDMQQELDAMSSFIFNESGKQTATPISVAYDRLRAEFAVAALNNLNAASVSGAFRAFVTGLTTEQADQFAFLLYKAAKPKLTFGGFHEAVLASFVFAGLFRLFCSPSAGKRTGSGVVVASVIAMIAYLLVTSTAVATNRTILDVVTFKAAENSTDYNLQMQRARETVVDSAVLLSGMSDLLIAGSGGLPSNAVYVLASAGVGVSGTAAFGFAWMNSDTIAFALYGVTGFIVDHIPQVPTARLALCALSVLLTAVHGVRKQNIRALKSGVNAVMHGLLYNYGSPFQWTNPVYTAASAKMTLMTFGPSAVCFSVAVASAAVFLANVMKSPQATAQATDLLKRFRTVFANGYITSFFAVSPGSMGDKETVARLIGTILETANDVGDTNRILFSVLVATLVSSSSTGLLLGYGVTTDEPLALATSFTMALSAALQFWEHPVWLRETTVDVLAAAAEKSLWPVATRAFTSLNAVATATTPSTLSMFASSVSELMSVGSLYLKASTPTTDESKKHKKALRLLVSKALLYVMGAIGLQSVCNTLVQAQNTDYPKLQWVEPDVVQFVLRRLMCWDEFELRKASSSNFDAEQTVLWLENTVSLIQIFRKLQSTFIKHVARLDDHKYTNVFDSTCTYVGYSDVTFKSVYGHLAALNITDEESVTLDFFEAAPKELLPSKGFVETLLYGLPWTLLPMLSDQDDTVLWTSTQYKKDKDNKDRLLITCMSVNQTATHVSAIEHMLASSIPEHFYETTAENPAVITGTKHVLCTGVMLPLEADKQVSDNWKKKTLGLHSLLTQSLAVRFLALFPFHQKIASLKQEDVLLDGYTTSSVTRINRAPNFIVLKVHNVQSSNHYLFAPVDEAIKFKKEPEADTTLGVDCLCV
jgi:hypothetical protein